MGIQDKLWEPTKCCCCIDRRTGALVIGILFLVSGCLNLLGSLRFFIMPAREIIRDACSDLHEVPDCENTIYKIMLGGTIFSLIISIIHITFSSLLIHGIKTQKTRFMIPLMVMYLIQIVFVLLMALAVVGLFMYLQVWLLVIIFIVIFGGVIFLETYFLLVIRAYYLEMKVQKGQIHMSLHNQGGAPPQYSDISAPATYYPDTRSPHSY